jgi:hypothetical protein
MQRAPIAAMIDAPLSTISTDTEVVRTRYPVLKKLDLIQVRDSAKAADHIKSPSQLTSVREPNSGPSTPLFMPSPKSLRSSQAKQALIRQSLTRDIILALSNNDNSVASITERYNAYLSSPDFKCVVLKDYSIRSFESSLILEALVEYDSKEVRVIAEGRDLAHQFADSLCEELFGCATSAVLEQLLQFSNQLSDDFTCLVVVKTQSLAEMGERAESVGLSTSSDSALTAALQAICAALSKVKSRNLEIGSRQQKSFKTLTTTTSSVATSDSSCFCLPRKVKN